VKFLDSESIKANSAMVLESKQKSESFLDFKSILESVRLDSECESKALNLESKPTLDFKSA